MALKLNVNRNYKHPVPVKYFSEEGKILSGSFTGTFRVLNSEALEKSKEEEGRFIDLILVGVEGIELEDDNGNILEGDELLAAVKNDVDLANACVEAYEESAQKKRAKPKISEK